MECQYGVQYKKSKFTSESKEVYLQGSQKKGCLAHIIISQFILYQEFRVHSLLSPNNHEFLSASLILYVPNNLYLTLFLSY